MRLNSTHSTKESFFMNTYRYVILGGGMVAGYAAQQFVEQGLKPGELCIVSNEATLPYERPPLSKDFLAGKAELNEILINDETFYREHGIELRLSTLVTAVDFAGKRLETADGEAIDYEKLLIATGARVKTLGIPGADLDGVLYLRSPDDSRRIRERTSQAKRVVVVGGGYIGLETSAVLSQRGPGQADFSTTVILSGDTLLPRLFTPEMSAFFRRYYEARGVTFITNARASALRGDGRVESIALDSGQEVPADAVVAGVGVVPQVALFEGSGLDLDQCDGIVVNEYLETNLPDVYAAGDAVNYRDVIFNKQRHVEHWNNATEGGRHAARVMMGQREPFRQLPYFFSDEFDLSWEFWGDVEGFDQTVHRGDVEAAQFSVWWLKEKRVVAAFVMNRPDEERELAPQWIEAGQEVDPALLRQADESLSALG
jgi:NADPH-dependent 2,4-dienoyl-CoA reductase/sulfur reductase-like enzyme